MQKIDNIIEENKASLENIIAHDSAKAKQRANRTQSQKSGHAGRLEQKGKARTAEKPWGGKSAR